jgi:antirestriction protein ArdC
MPSRDEIHLPPEGAFFDAEGYYGVALHELVHWTGHANRCGRDLRHRFGSEAYAAEELIAELGAAFLCAEIGISPEPRLDHARYIESWLKVLRNDTRAIFAAAAKANQAVTYLKGLVHQVDTLPNATRA